MKKIKSYKLFESNSDQFIEAKAMVEEVLIPLTDNGLKVDVIKDTMAGDDRGNLNCFSVIIENRQKDENDKFVIENIDFQSVLDDIWHAFSVVDEYGFYFYVITFNQVPGGMKIYWSPLDIVNIEEILEKVGNVNQITLGFTRKGMFQDKIESNKKSEKSSLVPEVEYKK